MARSTWNNVREFNYNFYSNKGSVLGEPQGHGGNSGLTVASSYHAWPQGPDITACQRHVVEVGRKDHCVALVVLTLM